MKVPDATEGFRYGSFRHVIEREKRITAKKRMVFLFGRSRRRSYVWWWRKLDSLLSSNQEQTSGLSTERGAFAMATSIMSLEKNITGKQRRVVRMEGTVDVDMSGSKAG